MNRIDACFAKLDGKKALVAYIVAGDPSLEHTAQLVHSLEKASVDIIELGIPFSDPLADGVVNQMASQRALDQGATIPSILQTVSAIRKTSSIPIVFFTYYNPVFRYGLAKLLADSEKAGVDGLLILDLPPEEAQAEWPASSPLKRITLIAPTTPPERIAAITANASGFVYYVSREGVTGMQQSVASNLSDQVARIRQHTKLPVCVGFGISTPQQARSVAAVADGVVVGSAIVDRIGKHGAKNDLAAHIGDFVQTMVQATKEV